MCSDATLFDPSKYFASSICGKTQTLLRAWAAMMFCLTLTGIFAAFSGCCLNGCCNCKQTFEPAPEERGKEMTSIACAINYHSQFPVSFTLLNPPPPLSYAQAPIAQAAAMPLPHTQLGPLSNPYAATAAPVYTPQYIPPPIYKAA